MYTLIIYYNVITFQTEKAKSIENCFKMYLFLAVMHVRMHMYVIIFLYNLECDFHTPILALLGRY